MRLAKVLAVAGEVVNTLWIFAICAEVIKIYSGISVPILSFFFADLHVNDVLAFFQALVIVLVPVFIFKAAFSSSLFSNFGGFFSRLENTLGFAVGLVALVLVFGLELYNLTTEARMALEELVDCAPGNPFCNQAEIDHQRDVLQAQV
ncbi:MAG: hypothetical protein AAFQ24_14010, partial [Pseudomonadota bacterium]